MLRLFIALAIAWALFVFACLGISPHFIAVRWFTFVYVSVVLLSLPFLWRWLEDYKATAGIAAKIDAAEGAVWSKLKLHLKGTANAILLALTSAWATAADWIHSTAQTVFGLQPGDLDPFKDVTLLHSFFSSDIVPKIVAGVTWFALILHLKQTRDAAKMVPAPGTAAPAAPAS